MKNIKILGSGSTDCVQLEELIIQIANELSLEYAIEKVTSINSILSYGVIMSPGLVIDEEVKSVGRVPSAEDIRIFLTEPPESQRARAEGFRGADTENQENPFLPF